MVHINEHYLKLKAGPRTPGRQGIAEWVAFYMENAALMRQQLGAAVLAVHGGEYAPYLWVATPDGQDSWTYFDRRYAGGGFWRGRRGLPAPVGLQSPRPDRRGHGAD